MHWLPSVKAAGSAAPHGWYGSGRHGGVVVGVGPAGAAPAAPRRPLALGDAASSDPASNTAATTATAAAHSHPTFVVLLASDPAYRGSVQKEPEGTGRRAGSGSSMAASRPAIGGGTEAGTGATSPRAERQPSSSDEPAPNGL